MVMSNERCLIKVRYELYGWLVVLVVVIMCFMNHFRLDSLHYTGVRNLIQFTSDTNERIGVLTNSNIIGI